MGSVGTSLGREVLGRLHGNHLARLWRMQQATTMSQHLLGSIRSSACRQWNLLFSWPMVLQNWPDAAVCIMNYRGQHFNLRALLIAHRIVVSKQRLILNAQMVPHALLHKDSDFFFFKSMYNLLDINVLGWLDYLQYMWKECKKYNNWTLKSGFSQ